MNVKSFFIYFSVKLILLIFLFNVWVYIIINGIYDMYYLEKWGDGSRR